MIKLYTSPYQWRLPSISPPCIEIETWLKMAEIPYERVTDVDLNEAPKGKVPYIDYQGAYLGDSHFIRKKLSQDFNVTLDLHLSAKEKAIASAFTRMLKENTYWGVVAIRYRNAKNWEMYKRIMASMLAPAMPFEAMEPQIDLMGEKVRSQMLMQGIGLHTEEEIADIILEDVGAVSDYLSSSEFFLGDRLSSVDAVVFAHISSIIIADFEGPIVEKARSYTNLVDYCERFIAHYFYDVPPKIKK